VCAKIEKNNSSTKGLNSRTATKFRRQRVKRGKYTEEAFCILWVEAKNFNANYAKTLEFVLRKHKNILFVMGATK